MTSKLHAPGTVSLAIGATFVGPPLVLEVCGAQEVVIAVTDGGSPPAYVAGSINWSYAGEQPTVARLPARADAAGVYEFPLRLSPGGATIYISGTASGGSGQLVVSAS